MAGVAARRSFSDKTTLSQADAALAVLEKFKTGLRTARDNKMARVRWMARR
jgi:hypothetical protein